MSDRRPPPRDDRVSTFSAPNDLSALDAIVAWTEGFLASRADGAELSGRLNLVVEELVVNIIAHGYAEGEAGEIDLSLREDRSGVTLIVEDRARPFDPLSEARSSDTNASLQDRAIGGLGVHLVRELTDSVGYERVAARNRITAHFAAPDRTPQPAGSMTGRLASELVGKGRLTFRFVAMFVGVFLIGLGCAGMLNYFKFERAFLEATQGRYDPVITETRGTIETSLGPGLPLASSFATATIIEKVAAQHGGVFDLAVFDADGERLFALDAVGAPGNYPHGKIWPRLAPGDVAHFREDDSLGAAAMISQGGEPVGVVVLTHDGAVVMDDINRLGDILLRAGLLIAAVAAPVLAFAAAIALRPLENRHLRVAAAIDALPERSGDLLCDDDAYGLIDGASRIESGLRGGADGEPRA